MSASSSLARAPSAWVSAWFGLFLLLPASSVWAQLPGSAAPGTNFGNITFDEQGNIVDSAGLPVSATFPAGGGIDFKLPGPVTPGTVLVLSAGDVSPTNQGGVSDSLVFFNDTANNGHLLYQSLIDDTDTVLDPADVPSFPMTTTVTTPETGPEGNNGFIYQTTGAIYFGTSDGTIPEPGALGLVAAAGALTFRRKRMHQSVC